jgi:hypothetical protein
MRVAPAVAVLALSVAAAVAVTAREPEAGPAVEAAAADAAPEFLRVVCDDDGEPVSLDTAVVEYRRPDEAARRGRPLQVDLVAAVHVGGADYYATLDRLFADYDAVLYELVAPPNARVPKAGRKPAGAIGTAQQGLKNALGLEFQLERIDYGADNFVHADLSPREFDAAMKKRGESWFSMFTKLMRESMARAERPAAGAEVGMGELFGILFGSGVDRQVRLRRLMAEQFTDMEVLTSAFGGEEGSTLITDRNAACIRVLHDEVARGNRRIAVFYGAAHMPDFDERLRKEFDLQPAEPEWLEAWDLRMPAPAARK